MKLLIRSALAMMAALVGLLAVLPASVQDNTTTMSILSAIGALRAVQGNDTLALKVMLHDDDPDDNSQAATCWFFDTDQVDFCVRIADGSVYVPFIIPEPVTTPEVNATPKITTPEVTPEVTFLEDEMLTLTKLEEAVLNAQRVNPNQTVIEVSLKLGAVPVWEVKFDDGRQAAVSVLTGDIVAFGDSPLDSLMPLTTPEVFSDNDNLTPLTTPEVSPDDDHSGRGGGGDDDDNDNNRGRGNGGDDDDDD